MPDRVQVVKRESGDLGGDPNDELPFYAPIEPQEDAIEAAGIYFQRQGARDTQVYIGRNSNDQMTFSDVENVPAKVLSDFLTQDKHKSLRQLVHLAHNGPYEGFQSGLYKEVLPSGSPFPTSITWWDSSSKTKKIVEKTISWSGAFPVSITWKAYSSDGSTVLSTVTDSITYKGPFEISRTRSVS